MSSSKIWLTFPPSNDSLDVGTFLSSIKGLLGFVFEFQLLQKFQAMVVKFFQKAGTANSSFSVSNSGSFHRSEKQY